MKQNDISMDMINTVLEAIPLDYSHPTEVLRPWNWKLVKHGVIALLILQAVAFPLLFVLTQPTNPIAIMFDTASSTNKINEALRLLQSADYAGAIRECDQAIQLDPRNWVPYYDRGVAYQSLGNLSQALQDYNRAIALSARAAPAHTNRGLIYLNWKEYDLAMQDFNAALSVSPYDGTALLDAGVANLNQREYDAAISDFSRAISVQPDYGLAYFNRGVAYLRQKHYDKAATDFTHVIDLKFDLAKAYYDRGLAYRYEDNWDAAITDFKKVLELSAAGNGQPQSENDRLTGEARLQLFYLRVK